MKAACCGPTRPSATRQCSARALMISSNTLAKMTLTEMGRVFVAGLAGAGAPGRSGLAGAETCTSRKPCAAGTPSRSQVSMTVARSVATRCRHSNLPLGGRVKHSSSAMSPSSPPARHVLRWGIQSGTGRAGLPHSDTARRVMKSVHSTQPSQQGVMYASRCLSAGNSSRYTSHHCTVRMRRSPVPGRARGMKASHLPLVSAGGGPRVSLKPALWCATRAASGTAGGALGSVLRSAGVMRSASLKKALGSRTRVSSSCLMRPVILAAVRRRRWLRSARPAAVRV